MDALLDEFAQRVTVQPDKPALTEGDVRLSYLTLHQISDHFAALLAAQDLPDNAVVAYFGPDGIENIITFMACQKAGFVFLPLNKKFPLPTLLRILSTAEARCCVSATLSSDDLGGIPVLALPDVQGFEPARGKTFTRRPLPGKYLATMLSTSGSTGVPKVVPLSRDTLQAFARVHRNELPLSGDDIWGHSGTMWFEFFAACLSAGATIACQEAADHSAEERHAWLKRERVSVLTILPTLFRTMSEISTPLPDLHRIFISGEAIDHTVLEQFTRLTLPGAELVNSLSQNEFPFGTAYRYRSGEPITRGAVPVGVPTSVNALSICGPDRKPVKPGTLGEITYRGPFTAERYIGDPERSAQIFRDEGDGTHSYFTGDMGYIDQQGVLHCTGRKDEQLKIRGFNVRPSDVEVAVVEIEGVREAVVTVDRCARNIPRLVCYYTGQVEVPALKRELSDLLPPFMVPQFFVKLSEMPKTANGKLRRAALQLPRQREADLALPQTPVQEQLWKIWEKILGHSDFGVTDNFFDQGGDSLRAMELLMSVQTRFQRKLTLDQFVLDGSTITSQEAALASPTAPTLRVVRHGHKKPELFLAHTNDGNVQSYFEFAASVAAGTSIIGVCADYSTRTAAFSIEEKAREAVAQLPPADHRIIMGYSYAGPLAFEMARLTQDVTTDLILLDPYAPFCIPTRTKLILRAKEILFPWRPYNFRRTLSLDFAYAPAPITVNRAAIITCEEYAPATRAKWASLIQAPIDGLKLSGGHMGMLRGANALQVARWFDDWKTEVPAQKVLLRA